MSQSDLLRRVRIWLIVFIIGLVVSGVTAFPLQTELAWFVSLLQKSPFRGPAQSIQLLSWMERVYQGLAATNQRYPFLAYGTDWLAFAHLVIAIAFIGPYLDPVRNKWVITFGLIACVGVLPLALIAGPVRGIPLPWRLVDCSFGIFGSLALLFCRNAILQLERMAASKSKTLS